LITLGVPARLGVLTGLGQLAAAMRHQLDRIQRQPALINGFLGQTGLALETEPP
jgi:hypothetical protein